MIKETIEKSAARIIADDMKERARLYIYLLDQEKEIQKLNLQVQEIKIIHAELKQFKEEFGRIANPYKFY